MTVPATTLSLTGDGPHSRASAGELLNFASGDDFARWERQLATTGNCANPVRLRGRIDAIDRATVEQATIYDTASEPGGVLRIPCGNRREDICPPCSDVYKGDAHQIIRSGLTGGKGIPESVATHPCVFTTLTAPGFGPVHTIRTGRGGRRLACRPRRDAHQRRCPHGRDLSCARRHREDDPRLGTPICPDCYDYTGHVQFNALAPELWRRFIIYLPRQLAGLAGVTQRQLRLGVRVRFVKVAEYQHRGIIHYHAVIRLDAAGDDYQPPSPRLQKGDSIRKVQVMRTVLSAALTRTVREELIVRNVARLVELPQWQRGQIRPWAADEARTFLAAAKPDPLYTAFVLLILYGLRRGEVLGLRWDDIDVDGGTIQIHQQLQRVRGELFLAPVKTQAGKRALPLLDVAEQAIKLQTERQALYRIDMGSAWPETGLVFTTRTGRPVEPCNFVRSFRRICDDNQIRLIKVHHIRHTVGSLLKDLGVPARDAQKILGHTRISKTLEIYTDTDEQARRDALTRLQSLLGETQG